MENVRGYLKYDLIILIVIKFERFLYIYRIYKYDI